MSTQEQISLHALYARSLVSASKASSLPTADNYTQDLVHSASKDLHLLTSRISHVHLFSRNEVLDDVSTGDLIYMSVPFISGEVELNVRAPKPDERTLHLRQAEALFRSFLSLLDDYGVIPNTDKLLYKQKASMITDPARRREVKIAQFKREKEMKGQIEALRSKRGQPEVDTSSIFATTLSLLPSSSSSSDNEDEDEEKDSRRATSILLIRLQAAQAYAQLESIDQELGILRNAPTVDDTDISKHRTAEDTTWRLDLRPQGVGTDQASLMDSQGRPLRPFTIFPSDGTSERSRIQDGVFRPDHRLPTMSIDEYLEVERQRGNVITGGGPQSANGPTKKEQLAIDSEMDGTQEGERKAEEKRREDERWARFTEANPRGAGNTMNRG